MSLTLLQVGDYLGARWEAVNDPAQMCSIAYAFNLLGHYAKDAAFLRAHSMRRTGEAGRGGVGWGR